MLLSVTNSHMFHARKGVEGIQSSCYCLPLVGVGYVIRQEAVVRVECHVDSHTRSYAVMSCSSCKLTRTHT